MSQTLLRGPALLPRRSEPRFDLLPDALLEIEGGRITAIGPAPPGCSTPNSHPGCVLLPGFVDTHLHFPQARVIGSASGPLLEWLERSIFPEEARYADYAFARAAAEDFCDKLVRQGTTCASVYASSHPASVQALFEAMHARGLRGQVGLVLMDRGAPEALLLPVGPAMDACFELAARWHGRDGLAFCVTPRFALSCTPELMAAAGRFAAEHRLPIQTHISENLAEIAATAEVFPEAGDYLAVYEAAGLVGPRTLLAHAIHLSEAEWGRVVQQRAAIAHCPDSNFFLGSGCMPLRAALNRGARVGLGTDVGAGRSFSLRRVAASAYDASLVVGARVEPEELLWLAGPGGAEAMGLGEVVGWLEPGMEADLVAVRCEGASAIYDQLLFQHDAPVVEATYVRGRRLNPRSAR